MKSLLALVKEFPQLRIYSIRAALNFGSLLAMWSCLAFKMGQALSCQQRHHRFAGIMRCGGSINRLLCGKIRKESGCPPLQLHRLRTDPLSWLLFFVGENTYLGIILGIIIIDIGMQCIQLSNQTSIFELSPRASNRINTIFMTTHFVGGSWEPSLRVHSGNCTDGMVLLNWSYTDLHFFTNYNFVEEVSQQNGAVNRLIQKRET